MDSETSQFQVWANDVLAAKEYASKTASGAFRAPHRSCNRVALMGELAIAAGGVLYFESIDRFSQENIVYLFNIWDMMPRDHRPTIICGLDDKAPEWVIMLQEKAERVEQKHDFKVLFKKQQTLWSKHIFRAENPADAIRMAGEYIDDLYEALDEHAEATDNGAWTVFEVVSDESI